MSDTHLYQAAQQGLEHGQQMIDQQAHELAEGAAQINQTMANSQASIDAGWAQEAANAQSLDQVFQSLNTDHPGTVIQGMPMGEHDVSEGGVPHFAEDGDAGYHMAEVPADAVVVEEVIILEPAGGHDSPFDHGDQGHEPVMFDEVFAH